MDDSLVPDFERATGKTCLAYRHRVAFDGYDPACDSCLAICARLRVTYIEALRWAAAGQCLWCREGVEHVDANCQVPEIRVEAERIAKEGR